MRDKALTCGDSVFGRQDGGEFLLCRFFLGRVVDVPLAERLGGVEQGLQHTLYPDLFGFRQFID